MATYVTPTVNKAGIVIRVDVTVKGSSSGSQRPTSGQVWPRA